MVSPLFDWKNMEKEYTLREAFVDFITQYKELSMELQRSRLQYGQLMDIIRSKDDLIAESMDTISKMNKRIKDDQKYINILIEKLCIHGNFDREYLESLRDEVSKQNGKHQEDKDEEDKDDNR